MSILESTADLEHIPIEDNGEPLIDFSRAGIAFSRRHPAFPFPRVHLLREGLVERLVHAQDHLPPGWSFLLLEGFRTVHCQRLQREANRRIFRHRHPDMPDDEFELLMETYSAPADHPRVPPPHATGGAFDVHLLDGDGNKVDLFSPFDGPVEAAAFDLEGLSETARANRAILKAVLEEQGITNYALEWWHWSYGDQGWACRGGHPKAVYGLLAYSVAEAEAIQGSPANREEPLQEWPVPLPTDDEVQQGQFTNRP